MPTYDQKQEAAEQEAQWVDAGTYESKKEVVNDSNDEDQYYITDPLTDDRSASEESKDEPEAHEDASDESSQDGKENKFPEDLVVRASVLGLNESEMGQFQDAEALETTLNLMDRAIINDASVESVEDTAGDASHSEVAAEVEEDTKYEFGVDEELLEPDMVKALKFVQDKHNKELSKLKESVSSVISASTQQKQAQFAEWVDKKFGSLDENWEKTFGKRPGHEMSAKSPEFAGRIKVLNAMDALSRVHNPSDRDGLFERALRAEFGDKVEDNVRQEVASGNSKRRSQALNRPNSRKAGQPKVDKTKTATSNLNKKLESFGMADGEEAPEAF